MSDVTPPTNSPAALLGWVVAGLVIVAGTLLRALEKTREAALADLKAAHANELTGLKAAHASEVAGLVAQLDEARRREAERREERDRLGRLYDDERQKRAWDAESMIRRLTPDQIRSFDRIEEESTMVREAVTIAQAAISPPELAPSENRRLERYSRGEALTTPPEAPRPRAPSRAR